MDGCRDVRGDYHGIEREVGELGKEGKKKNKKWGEDGRGRYKGLVLPSLLIKTGAGLGRENC